MEATKPVASRSTSAEIYVICMGFKAPAKLDPHLFDVKHVFKEVQEEPKVKIRVSSGLKSLKNPKTQKSQSLRKLREKALNKPLNKSLKNS